MAIVQRGGEVRTKIIPDVNGKNLKDFIWDNVDRSARIMTDESRLYNGLDKEFASHETTKHSAHEYARGDVHSNTAKGFFAILKRGIYGTYHNVSKEHLHRYCSEFAYKYNTRKMTDGQRLSLAIQKADGKRLFYKEPVGEKA